MKGKDGVLIAVIVAFLLASILLDDGFFRYYGSFIYDTGSVEYLEDKENNFLPEFFKQRSAASVDWYMLLSYDDMEIATSEYELVGDYVVPLKSGSIVPAEGLDESLTVLGEGENRHVMVQMRTVLDRDASERFVRNGISLEHITASVYVASLSKDQMFELIEDTAVRAIFPIPAEAKLSPYLLRGEIGSWATDGKRVAVVVYFFEDVQESRRLGILSELDTGVVSEMPADGAIYVIVDRKKIELLAGIDEVLFVGLAPPPLEPGNDGVRRVSNVDPVQTPPYSLDGTGVKALIYDVGPVDLNHPDLFGRVTFGETPSGYGGLHATHVAGTFGGSGISRSDRLYRGVATNALIYSFIYEFCRPNCMYNSPQDLESNYNAGINRDGVHLATNSLTANIAQNGYPCSWLGDYESTSQLLDRIVYEGLPSGRNFGLPVLFVAGNERGPVRCGTGYSTLTVPGGAKNILSVGAVNTHDLSMASFSSWGPADDGRLKPDLVAGGCELGGDGGVTSTRSGGGYVAYCGTSMATPAVAGIIALLLQQYRNNYWQTSVPFTLRNGASNSARMKALLLHTARDLGNTGPDYQFGYGLADARASVDQLRGYRSCIVEKQLDTSNVPDEFVVNVPSNPQGILRATITWDDPPASPLAAVTLVNDLDLRFVSPSGSVSLPLVLNPAQPSVNAVPGNNNRDNVEQIQMQATEGGAWRVKIFPTSVPRGPQRYSLIVTPPSGVPIVSLTGGAPVIGNQGFKVQTDDATSQNLPFILVLHLRADYDIPLGDGRIIRINPSYPYMLVNGVLDANGRATVPAPIPNDPSFAGVTVYATAIILDPMQAGTPQYIKGISCTVPMLFTA